MEGERENQEQQSHCDENGQRVQGSADPTLYQPDQIVTTPLLSCLFPMPPPPLPTLPPPAPPPVRDDLQIQRLMRGHGNEITISSTNLPSIQQPFSSGSNMEIISRALESPPLSAAARVLLQAMQVTTHSRESGTPVNTSISTQNHHLPISISTNSCGERAATTSSATASIPPRPGSWSAQLSASGSPVAVLGPAQNVATIDNLGREKKKGAQRESSRKRRRGGRKPMELPSPQLSSQNDKSHNDVGSKREKLNYKYRPVIASEIPNQVSVLPGNNSIIPPYEHLKRILLERKYLTKTMSSQDLGYRSKPSPLQRASFGNRVISAANNTNTDELMKLLLCGLSRDPCNAFSEGLLHMACKRGNHATARCLLMAGGTVYAADDFGRTPVHFAAWSGNPSFETAELLLNNDQFLLLVTDQMGRTPLEYSSKVKWKEWIQFLERKKEAYFPLVGPRKLHLLQWKRRAISASEGGVQSCCIPDPDKALPVKLAGLVASGKIDPDFVRRCRVGTVG